MPPTWWCGGNAVPADRTAVAWQRAAPTVIASVLAITTVGCASGPAPGLEPGGATGGSPSDLADADPPASTDAPELPDDDPAAQPRTVDRPAAAAASDDAACVIRAERDPLSEAWHFDPGDPVDLDEIYPDLRPAHSGPHVVQVIPLPPDGSAEAASEAALTHNLEHGAVVVWFDPRQVTDAEVAVMRSWVAATNGLGFRENPPTGAGVTVAAFEDPGLDGDRAVALRAWGTAIDCDRWDDRVADAFVVDHYGTRGIGPERSLAPYPEGALEFTDAAAAASP